MKIREMSWSNYRRLLDRQIAVRDHRVLVGPNDTGKPNIVRALKLCIGMAHGLVANAVTARDLADPARPLRLTVTLDGHRHDDRAAFPDEIDVGPPEVLRVAVEATVDPADPEQIAVHRHFPRRGACQGP